MDDEPPFSAVFLPRSSVLWVSGCTDELSVAEFRQARRDATRRDATRRDATDGDTQSIVVDLEDVSFLPSMAIGALLGAMARAPGTRVEVSGGKPAHKVLPVLGLYEYASTGRKRSGALPLTPDRLSAVRRRRYGRECWDDRPRGVQPSPGRGSAKDAG